MGPDAMILVFWMLGLKPTFSLSSFTFIKRLFSSLLSALLRRLSYLSLLFFGTLHSNGYVFPFLLCLSLLFFSQLFVSPPQTAILSVCISFSWGWFWWLPPVQCHKPSSIVLQALCPWDLIPWIYFSLPLYNHKEFDLGHTWMVLVVFPIFFSLSLNLAIRSSWSEPQSASSLVFADFIELLYLWLQRI